MSEKFVIPLLEKLVKVQESCYRKLVGTLYFCMMWQSEWKVEIKEQLQKIKSEGACYPRQLEEELIRRRRQELRFDLLTLPDPPRPNLISLTLLLV